MTAPTCINDLESYANAHLPKQVASFYAAGSEEEQTKRRNVSAFRKVLIRPRVLHKPVDNVNLSTCLLGGKIRVGLPIGVAPTAFHAYAHPHAEIGSARAAANSDTLMVLSGWSNTALEAVKSASQAELWQNIYLYKIKDKAKSMIRRAEKCGYSAIVVSVDIAVLGNKRGRDNILRDRIPAAHFDPENVEFDACAAGDPAATWEYFEELCRFTHLPLVAKGILTGEDAKNAISHGAAAVIVSNHGGRQLDGVPSSARSSQTLRQRLGGDAMTAPTCINDLESYANAHLPKQVASFYAAGSEEEQTKRRNVSAFRKVLIRPRVLHKPVDNVNLSTCLLGGKIRVGLPIGVAPTAFHAYAHPHAEIGSARAAANSDTLMVLSGWSNTALEAVKSASQAELWQNIYLYKIKDKAKSMIRRAEKCGYSAIVVSVDIAVLGNKRGRDNILRDRIPAAHFDPENVEFDACAAGDPAATWEYFEELCRFTHLPLVAKGILTGPDLYRNFYEITAQIV